MGWFWGKGSRTTAEEITEGVDITGQTAIVTGGAGGIGVETVRVLAKRGAHVYIAARNLEAASKVRDQIVSENPNAKVGTLELDLSSMASVRKAANNFLASESSLNILVNNAGIMMHPYQLSKDGIELQFATNHIGHFLFTSLLLERITKTAKDSGIEGRIVNVSSTAHIRSYKGGIRFDDINSSVGYSSLLAYGQSKLANVLHANELARRLQKDGANVTANSVHPGVIKTDLGRHAWYVGVIVTVLWPFVKNVQQGAATTCYVAAHPSVRGVSGKYFQDCHQHTASADAENAEMGARLWALSMQLTSPSSLSSSSFS